ncbi:MAG: acyl-ACP--UDP-N-acetylglucosamine O-acyltransferase [Planctomycetaceae bacterium]|nr:acyl-ACP--UDP-N-acetylglucosamine O-acyltransferase [Planctomycetaceae bacterium]
MPTQVSSLSDVHQSARIGDDVEIGPFCVVGPDVTIGDGTKLDSNVSILGKVFIGERNRFWPNSVIGGEPQDVSFRADADTGVEIGDDNLFREGVTVSRGAEKEDHWTRIGSGNMLMANAHVAHNCHVFNNTFLVNGVLLGGHVHVHDRAIVSGNSVVHHFATIGKLAFISGGCRVPTDIPPFMLACGSDNPEVRTINLIGMRRAGISEPTIRTIKRAHRLVFREHKRIAAVRKILTDELEGIIPLELNTLLTAIEQQSAGKQGRARESVRDTSPVASQQSKAA